MPQKGKGEGKLKFEDCTDVTNSVKNLNQHLNRPIRHF